MSTPHIVRFPSEPTPAAVAGGPSPVLALTAAGSQSTDERPLTQHELKAAGFRWSMWMRCWVLPYRDGLGADACLCWFASGHIRLSVDAAAIRCQTWGQLRRVFEVLDLSLNDLAGGAS